jgi:hypothetical protein
MRSPTIHLDTSVEEFKVYLPSYKTHNTFHTFHNLDTTYTTYTTYINSQPNISIRIASSHSRQVSESTRHGLRTKRSEAASDKGHIRRSAETKATHINERRDLDNPSENHVNELDDAVEEEVNNFNC